ncbi:MAG: hypothetical protein ACO1SV_17755 [Fimbriimonas sp.]
MVPHFALGMLVRMAEFEAIQDAYRELPRLSYTAVTYTKEGYPVGRVDGKYVSGQGFFLQHRESGTKGNRVVSAWKGARGYYLCYQTEPPSTPNEDQELHLYAKSGPWEAVEGTSAGPGAYPLIFSEHGKYGSLPVDVYAAKRTERLPSLRVGGRTFHRRAFYLGTETPYPVRTIYTFDAENGRLREVHPQGLEGGVFVSGGRTVFTYHDAARLTAKDLAYRPRTPQVPRFAARPSSRPKPDRPTPTVGHTVEAIEQALIERYGAMATYRDRVQTVSGTPVPDAFRIALAMDRKAGHRVVRRNRFGTIVGIRRGDKDFTWQVDAGGKGQMYFATGGRAANEQAYVLSSSMIMEAWRGGPLQLKERGWRLRSDTLRGRSAHVLYRKSVLPDFGHVPTPGRREIGEEEIWIDSASGLIVRSRRFGREMQGQRGMIPYDVRHAPEPNVLLAADDLAFDPPIVDAVGLMEQAMREPVRSPFNFSPY